MQLVVASRRYFVAGCAQTARVDRFLSIALVRMFECTCQVSDVILSKALLARRQDTFCLNVSLSGVMPSTAYICAAYRQLKQSACGRSMITPARVSGHPIQDGSTERH